ncbi:FAD-dependent oxidoreductase [Nocardioides sp. Root1257]|uniref:NAD(P)/FAD-dependent oxidoreductase n=1 Tax=unclassified Nocardioides TaxID=2615069 RepID=UPI0007022282|nr:MULTISPECIES: FAD-dependent oxidoreductase [unclassified Nocardioides]KQW47663.1 FAD-dependent oxidoreductase [Nocardioides sp. Root1257]KRC45818.1 FAD-dependent oxidoreductase [Nocardioides sp. Root224]
MPARQTAYERHAPASAVVEAALAGSQHSVFWLEDAPGTTYDALAGATDADLVVVGGGYCGLWTAVLAKRRNPGARVVLLEASTIGWAASGRNGGFCEASLTHGEENGRSRWPDEYDELERLGAANLDAFEADVRDLGIDCQYERTGSLSVAVEPHQVEWLGPHALDREAVRAEIDSPLFLAGEWERDTCALVHPARLARELARVAVDLGVEIHEQTRVTGLDAPTRGPVVVATTSGSVTADRVALATNVFPSLLRRARLMTVPVYDYVLMTEPLSDAQLASIGWSHRQGLGDLANQFHYSRLTADNRILWGGYDAVYHAGRRVRASYEERPATFTSLASHFLAAFPQLEGISFSHRWAGAIDTSTQFVAFHGLASRGRVSYAAGFTGLGVGATRFAAEVMLDRLSGLTTERTRLEMVRRTPLPFPPEPFAALGINATRWSLDRADHREGRRNLFLKTLDAVGLGFDS